VTWLNTEHGYGALTKLCHWLIVGLFAFQYLAGFIMVRLAPGGIAIGLSQDDWFNWHKSIGLVALVVAICRLGVRNSGRLPDWAPQLQPWEKRFIHTAEQLLYGAMLLMPVSGFIYVMAGCYGVRLFGIVDLANPIGEWDLLAAGAVWTHILCAIGLLATVAGHVGLVLRHELLLRDGLLRRMLPRSASQPTRPS
jgi:cytochrome b561